HTWAPTSADWLALVIISVDRSSTGPAQTTLVFTPTGVLTGPNTADREVPEDKLPAVLDAFSAVLPDQRLPFGLAPTSEGARGSDIIIEGIAEDITIALPQFRQS